MTTNKLRLTLDEEDQAKQQQTKPCATPRGFREIPLQITPSTWKTDLTKCNVCGDRFTWLNHRHKCRNCWQAVCNSCAKSRKT
ncbi:conserved unknown protein [Ectocarpus siliculosus]|uniref:FYVE-type domain-containing protein n=1 Tax=Ectocarpus siliculosus TaxID=2880 RepID=D7G5L4_ECTSI|nr:conserved unknown protein [Ectocarpus siliculosus]|eukprot:CBJ33860.1 conserved unknown protein [Ectocarpus siliculosus]